MIAAAWPLLLYTSLIVLLVVWWTFDISTHYVGFVSLAGLMLLAVLLCLLLRWVWLPQFERAIPALSRGGRWLGRRVYAPRYDAALSDSAITKRDRSIPWLLTLWIAVTASLALTIHWIGYWHLGISTVHLAYKLPHYPVLALARIALHWAPAFVVTVLFCQFLWNAWQGVLSLVYSIGMGHNRFKWWREVTNHSLREALRHAVERLCPNLALDGDETAVDVAGAWIWNQLLADLHQSHILGKEDFDSLCFIMNPSSRYNDEVQRGNNGMLQYEIARRPQLSKAPESRRARDVILQFLCSCRLESIPYAPLVEKMPSVALVLPVGGREPIYSSWSELVRPRNTETTLLRHLLQLYRCEFHYFRDATYPPDDSPASISGGSGSSSTLGTGDNLTNRHINNLLRLLEQSVLNNEPIPVLPNRAKQAICLWAASRVVCTFRNLVGQTRGNQSLYLLAMLQDPSISAIDAAALVASKRTFTIGLQGYEEGIGGRRNRFGYVHNEYSDDNTGSLAWMLQALDELLTVRREGPIPGLVGLPAVSRFEHVMHTDFSDYQAVAQHAQLISALPRCGWFEFVYQWQDPMSKLWHSKSINTLDKTGCVVGNIPSIFTTVGFGKPWNQNFMVPFCIDSDVMETLDVNQDLNPGQGFFLPAVLQKFDDPDVHLVAGMQPTKVQMSLFTSNHPLVWACLRVCACIVPDDYVNLDWNIVAFASSLSQRAFACVSQRVMAMQDIRFHYGHSDFVRTSFAVGASGLSRSNILSEDVTLGMDVILRGGRVDWADYYCVGKAKDTDVLAMTKFERKVAGGGPQIGAHYMWNQLSTAPTYCGWNWRYPVRSCFNLLRRMSMFISLLGWYLTHTVLTLSVFILCISLAILLILDEIKDVSSFSYELARSYIYIHLGIILFIPGFMQLLEDRGFIKGTWSYVKRAIPLAFIGVFHST